MTKVSIVTFQYVLRALEAKTKISIKDMLGEVNLSMEILSKHDSKVESKKLSDIFRFCMKKTGDSNLALHIGQSIPYQSLGLLGYLLLNTHTLQEMIEKFNHYQKLISAHLKFNFSDNGSYYKLAIYINENPLIPVPSFHAEVHLCSIISILTQILGEKVTPEFTHFTHKSIENQEEYRKIFGENLYFQKDDNAIFFKKDNLNIPVKNSNPSMLEYFEKEANKILEELETTTWYSKVEREILKNIGDEDITIEYIASNFNLSVRTLQNYLKIESKTFREALSNVRQRLAQHYIKNTKMDYTTISLLLGYSEASSFFRAYKKWYNKTPKQSK